MGVNRVSERRERLNKGVALELHVELGGDFDGVAEPLQAQPLHERAVARVHRHTVGVCVSVGAKECESEEEKNERKKP